MPAQLNQPKTHQNSASANKSTSNSSASASSSHKKSVSNIGAFSSTTKRNPSPKTPPTQSGSKQSEGYLSPSSQACESGNVSPSQEGVKRADRKTFHSPPGDAIWVCKIGREDCWFTRIQAVRILTLYPMAWWYYERCNEDTLDLMTSINFCMLFFWLTCCLPT